MPKAKISATIETTLLTQLATQHPNVSRSEALEAALTAWLAAAAKARLDDQVRAYYQSADPADFADDADWARVGLAAFEDP